MHSSSGVLHLHFVINLKNESNLLKQKKTRSVVSETVHTIGATHLKKTEPATYETGQYGS